MAPIFRLPAEIVVEPEYEPDPDNVSDPAPDFVRFPMPLAMIELTLVSPAPSKVRFAEVAAIAEPVSCSNPAVEVMVVSAPSVMVAESVLVPLRLRRAPTPLAPVPLIVGESAIVTPPCTCRVALLATVTPPLELPSELLFDAMSVPAFTEVAPS